MSNKFINLIIILFIALSACCVGYCVFGFSNTVKASEQSPSASLFLPNTQMEYSFLNNPIDVYSDDFITAVAQDDQTLLLYKGDKFVKIDASFTAIKQIKKFNNDTLLISDSGPIYKIDVNTLQITELKDSEDKIISGNYFDINGSYLVTAYSDKALVYNIVNNQCVRHCGFTELDRINVDANFPIAINKNNDIFYINRDNELRIKNINSTNTPDTILENVTPTKMVANQKNVFYIQGKFIYNVSLDDYSKHQFIIKSNSEYDLGKLLSPFSITFKNDNLLIADTNLDAIQEFKVVDNTLEFTGFAIASGKKAYNRANVSASDIMRTGDKIAYLESNRFNVITIASDRYAKENYKDYFAEDLGGVIPTAFALGLDYALLSYNQGTTSSELKLLNLKNNQLTQLDLPFTIVEDVCYQSGFFYAIITDNNKNNVYKVKENGTQLELVIENANIDATHLTADVLGNIFLSDNNGRVIKFVKNNNFAPLEIETKAGIEKMQTDLGGNLFVLSPDGISRWDGTQFIDLQISPIETNDTIKSFTMSFDTDEVYLLYHNREFVAYATGLGNVALSQIIVPNDYITTAPSTSIDKLKMATIIDDANVYSVQKNALKFDYLGLVQKTDEYVVICDIAIDQSLTLTALAEKNGVVLVNKTQIEISDPIISQAPEKAFVTTDVNAYYFPIINRNTDYALSDTDVIRLKKNTRITPLSTVTVNTEHNGVISDTQFYIASFYDGQILRTGYIPVSFTVETLREDFEWHNLKIETIKQTTLYADSNLTEELQLISEGTIRIIEKTSTYTKVAIKTEDGFIVGYISPTAIINAPQIAIRNILLVLAVVASICGTTTYFILRKKKY